MYKIGNKAKITSIQKEFGGFSEIKTIESAIDHSADFGYTLYTLNDIAEGSTEDTRVGKKLMNLDVRFSYQVFNVASNVGADLNEYNSYNRFLIIYDSQPEAGVPTSGELFSGAYYQQANTRQRFTWLYDSWYFYLSHTYNFWLPAYDGAYYTRSPMPYDTYARDVVRVPINLPTKYRSAGGALTDIEDGAIYLLYHRDTTTSNNPHWEVYTHTSITYVDGSGQYDPTATLVGKGKRPRNKIYTYEMRDW